MIPRSQITAFTKEAAELSTASRDALSEGAFALPGRRYPIHDEAHARNALARVAQFGTSAEKSHVRAAVHSRFPEIGKEAAVVNPLRSAAIGKWKNRLLYHPAVLEASQEIGLTGHGTTGPMDVVLPVVKSVKKYFLTKKAALARGLGTAGTQVQRTSPVIGHFASL